MLALLELEAELLCWDVDEADMEGLRVEEATEEAGTAGEKRGNPAGKDRGKVCVAAAESVAESERSEVDSGGTQPAGGALSAVESPCVKERRCGASEVEEEDDEEDVEEGRLPC